MNYIRILIKKFDKPFFPKYTKKPKNEQKKQNHKSMKKYIYVQCNT